ncbi:hypothetical protein KDL01_04020 [Actinospica durhamensis]|uniref:Secreted protein n=1 Tax=Actinospica durhamensis TaxID=1508375 RepID=A0A941IM31_9ACTN|nr:hypothetical protein [Actinospica durhamensis]MBR7832409.1 hypothetical protein [Actinospica durhamensis]
MSKRALYAVLAWAAATATAMAVVWAGLDSVLSTATGGPHVADIAAWPVQDAATTAAGSATGSGVAVSSVTVSPSASASPSATRAHTGVAASSPAAATSSPAPSLSPTPSAPVPESDEVERRYTTPGGTVVLTIGAKIATLDAATPAPGFNVQSWKGDGFVEVEFAPPDAGTAYEVIATWAGTSPTVQTVTAGG